LSDDEAGKQTSEEEAAEGEETRGFVDRHLGIFFRESTLWPVTIVVAMSAGSFLAAMILLALVDRSLPAMGALLIVTGMRIDGLQREIRPTGFGTLSGLIVGLWAVGGALAFVAHHYGVF